MTPSLRPKPSSNPLVTPLLLLAAIEQKRIEVVTDYLLFWLLIGESSPAPQNPARESALSDGLFEDRERRANFTDPTGLSASDTQQASTDILGLALVWAKVNPLWALVGSLGIFLSGGGDPDAITPPEDSAQGAKDAKPINGNKAADDFAKEHGYDDAHDLKDQWLVGEKDTTPSHYDIYVNNTTKEVFLKSKDGTTVILTDIKP